MIKTLLHLSFPLVLLFFCVLTGCTVEKRLYRKGWNISSNHRWKQQDGHETMNAYAEKELFAQPAVSSVRPVLFNAAPDSAEATIVSQPVRERATALPRNAETMPELTIAPKAVDDTVAVDEETYQKYVKAENHWSRKAKIVSCVSVSVAGIAAFAGAILLLNTLVFDGTLLAALLLLTLVLLLVLLVMACIPTREAMLAKLEKERIRRKQLEDELKELPPDAREAILADDAAERKRRNKIKMLVIFCLGGLVVALIALNP